MAAIIGVVVLLAPKGVYGRWLGIIGFLPLFFVKVNTPEVGQVWLTMLDVGQGLSVVIQTKNHVLVYDTGPKFSENFDAGQNIIVPYLRYSHIKRVDMLVVSHGDEDHIGGAYSLLRLMPVMNILTSVPNRFKYANYCQAGQHWNWDGVLFKMLSPMQKWHLSGNDASCVLQIITNKNRILLTGDIEAQTESLLVQKYGVMLRSNILLAPHHGSNTSSTPTFINSVRPSYVLFSTGFLNRFHFPSKKVLARYQKLSAKLFNTANLGAVTFR